MFEDQILSYLLLFLLFYFILLFYLLPKLLCVTLKLMSD